MSLSSWLTSALMTMLLWGFWGFFGKLAARTVTPQNATILSVLGWAASLPFLIIFFRRYQAMDWGDPNYYFAFLTGLLGSLGGLFYYFALSRGEASRVVAVTATYPLVSVFLAAVFLREPITLPRLIGVALALGGIYFLSI
ncbi:MAG: EamA family transporter [Anaerolineales bacterium]|nr:EamA family transporter [Anaerolineales bacterium]